MRLNSIRLAGFKSFVEPTTIQLDPVLCAIVGPNGCGKSNIVDGLRWAIGERSAQVLRGSTFDDVIFNGSDQRSASSHASVELLFDNSDAKIGGEYAAYTEISVRRELSTDQPSEFFLNGRRCRSRDIQDLFLGTGFGIKGYAIISQDRTDQIVRSKPEELRQYVEEAAGVSSYRERRHETELKIQRTEQNILRVNDSVVALASDIRRLSRQVSASRRYQQLQDQIAEQTVKQLAWMIRDKTSEIEQASLRVAELETESSRQEALEQRLDTELLELRETRVKETKQRNERQSAVYEYQSKVSRNETDIEVHEERINSLTRAIERGEEQVADYSRELTHDQEELSKSRRALGEVEEQSKRLDQEMKLHGKDESAKQTVLRETQTSFEELRRIIQETSEQRIKYEHEISDLEKTVINSKQRLSELSVDMPDLSDEKQRLEALSSERKKAEVHQNELRITQEEYRKESVTLENQLSSLHAQLEESQEKVQEMATVLSSLKAEQEIALGLSQETPKLKTWLTERKLGANRRLLPQLKVENGWESAVEIVLGTLVRAIEVENVIEFNGSYEDLKSSGGVFVMPSKDTGELDTASLLNKVNEGSNLVREQLANVLVAEDFVEALQKYQRLSERQSLITREGIWIGRNWVRFPSKGTMRQHVIARTGEIEQKQREHAAQNASLMRQTEKRDQLIQKLAEIRSNSEDVQNKLMVVATEVATKSERETAKRQAIEQAIDRKQEIEREVRSHDEVINAAQQDRERIQERWEHADKALEAQHAQLAALEESRELAQRAFEHARSQVQATSDKWHEVQRVFERIKTEIQTTEQQCARQSTRIEELVSSLTNQKKELQGLKSELPRLRSSQSIQLEEQSKIENLLKEQDEKVQAIEETIESKEINRRGIEQDFKEINGFLAESRVALGNHRSGLDYLFADLRSFQVGKDEAIERLTDDDDLDRINEELERLQRRFDQFGPINHQAIEEHEQKVEQKKNKDQQLADLEQALATLKSAMAHIDQEIRGKVKHTFDEINKNLDKVLPRLFGGGKAMLEMTGESLLDAGIVMRVKPPGKANLPINLLSGGEKALAALSFVFAVFLLNPSPVCILDEVDAPLDQQNVERFADLLNELVETQFVVITHNPLTMERTKHLLGVTMQEPGVSRVVSVSLDTAIEFAQAS